MLNRIMLMGRLTVQPELKYTPNNVAVLTAAVACERDIPGKDGKRETDFINVVFWRGTAEFVKQYFVKGQMIAVDGRLQMRKWTANDGTNRVTYEVVADHAYFAGGKPNETNGAGNGAMDADEAAYQAARARTFGKDARPPSAPPAAAPGGFVPDDYDQLDIDADDVPF